MDRTLNMNKRSNKRRKARNNQAWQLHSPDGTSCRYCPHDHTQHRMSSGQPHFYRPATPQEVRDPAVKVYTHKLPDGEKVTVRRVRVANKPELLTSFCIACAREKDTAQVLCYQRTLAKGEVIGVGEPAAADR